MKLSFAGIKLFVTLGIAAGSLAAWALDHFESKEHATAIQEGDQRLLEAVRDELKSTHEDVRTLLNRRE